MQTLWKQTQEQQIIYSAAAFRRLIDSLSRPGKLTQIDYPDFLGTPPLREGVSMNMYALGALESLLDSEVSFCLAEKGEWQTKSHEGARWLLLRSGAHLLSDPTTATFAFFCEGTSGGLIKQLNQGTLLEPENSATAFYCVEKLSANNKQGLTLELSGPGIKETSQISVVGLDKNELEYIGATRQNYPLGVDVYLIDTEGQCVGLPRTTVIKVVKE